MLAPHAVVMLNIKVPKKQTENLFANLQRAITIIQRLEAMLFSNSTIFGFGTNSVRCSVSEEIFVRCSVSEEIFASFIFPELQK